MESSQSTGQSPMFREPFKQPMQKASAPVPTTVSALKAPKNKSSPLVRLAAIIELLIIIVLAAIIVVGPRNKPTARTTTSSNQPASDQANGPAAATDTSVQAISDSINQDISGLNDDQDLPTSALSDQGLGLGN